MKKFRYKVVWYSITKNSGYEDFDDALNDCAYIKDGWKVRSVLEHGWIRMKVLLEKPETDG